MFTFHRTITYRNITFSTKEHPNNIQCVDSAEARTCYIFKITTSLIPCYNTQSHMFWRLSIFKETNRQIDTDRPTGMLAERQTCKETRRQTGRQADRQAGRDADG